MSRENRSELTQIAVRVDREMLDRLDRLVARTGRTRTYYLRTALEAQMATLEAAFLGEQQLIEREIGNVAPAGAASPQARTHKVLKRAAR